NASLDLNHLSRFATKASPSSTLQRKLLHTAIYDSLCWNFRRLLPRRPSPLPTYEAVILDCQKKTLAAAA
ncbi:trascription factor, partial [Colletotrichum musicola]